MEEDAIGLDDLVKTILAHFAEADDKYRVHYANKIGAEFTDEQDVISGVGALLLDPEVDVEIIIDLANELLPSTYTYDGDSLVTVRYDLELSGQPTV